MCFFKETGYEITNQDIYILKSGEAKVSKFESQRGFIYDKGVYYYKNWFCKLLALFRRELNGEVFHVFGFEFYKHYIANRGPESYVWREIIAGAGTYRYGIFRIPKGTRYYENKRDMEIATFDIEYIGPLMLENREIILQQKPLNEIEQSVPLGEGQTKGM